MYSYEQAGPVRRLIRRMAGTRPMGWFYARTLHHIDRLMYRLTGGRVTFSAWLSGLPVVMLTTTGAKSGQVRTLPLVGIPDGDDVVVIASNYGQRRNPSWYHNLRAHPQAKLVFDGKAREVLAQELAGEERERYYALGIDIYPGWVQYRERAAHRQIPVIRLEPRA